MHDDLLAKQLTFLKHFKKPFGLTVGGTRYEVALGVQLWVPRSAFPRLEGDPETKQFTFNEEVHPAEGEYYSLVADVTVAGNYGRRKILFESSSVNSLDFHEGAPSKP